MISSKSSLPSSSASTGLSSVSGEMDTEAAGSPIATKIVSRPAYIDIKVTPFTLGKPPSALAKMATHPWQMTRNPSTPPYVPSNFVPLVTYDLDGLVGINYRIVDKDNHIVQDGFVFSVVPGGGAMEQRIKLTKNAIQRGAALHVWATPYGHASIAMVKPEVGQFLRGRDDYPKPPPAPGKAPESTGKFKLNTKYEYYATAGVLTYLVKRMQWNAGSGYTDFIRQKMESGDSISANRVAYEMFRNEGAWDLKPDVALVWGERNRLGDMVMKEPIYLHDVWSNIHFGYVSMYCGFDLDDHVLVAANIYSWATTFGPDPKEDQEATRYGYSLAESGTRPTVDIIRSEARPPKHPIWRYP